jgi:folate-dependent phosphoribosylglycinamide formyltransferase PurN
MTRTRIGLLTSQGYPLLGYMVDRISAVRGTDLLVVIDSQDVTDRDHRLFAERTEGGMLPRPFDGGMCRSVTVNDHNGEDTLRLVRQEHIDLLVNVCTPRRIGSQLLAEPRLGVLNVHPGILPKYRGASCCEWAIYHDGPVGVSAHFMDEGLDSGPIIFTRELDVAPGQTYSQVRVGLYKLWADVAGEAVAEVIDRGLTPGALAPQPNVPVFKRMPDALLAEVKEKLARGAYAGARRGERTAV